MCILVVSFECFQPTNTHVHFLILNQVDFKISSRIILVNIVQLLFLFIQTKRDVDDFVLLLCNLI